MLQPAGVRDGRGGVALCLRVQRLHHQPLPAGGAASKRYHPVEEREREKRLLWKWGESKDEEEGEKKNPETFMSARVLKQDPNVQSSKEH